MIRMFTFIVYQIYIYICVCVCVCVCDVNTWRYMNHFKWNMERHLQVINTKLKIIIIIMSCRQHRYPWPFHATSPYHSSPPAGLPGYILCPPIVAVCKFELVVLLLHGHMWGSIGVHHLWARPCFSSSVPRVWFV